MNTAHTTSPFQLAPEWMKQRKPTKKTSSSTLGSKSNAPFLISQSGAPLATHLAGADDEASRPVVSPQHSYTTATGPQMTYSSLLVNSEATASGLNGNGAELDDNGARLPFRYSKEQMLHVWKDGGGQGALNLEVERWPGIVRQVAVEPAGLREWTIEERKVSV